MRPDESLIGQPIRSLQTMLRTISKWNKSSFNLIPDGIYGPQTTLAVTRFQKDHNLPATGVTDQQTWDAIVREYESILVEDMPAQPLDIPMAPKATYQPGCRCANIRLAQSMLDCLSECYHCFAPPEASGSLDSTTSECLTQFQKMCGLPENGCLDKVTWKHLALQYPLAASLSNNP